MSIGVVFSRILWTTLVLLTGFQDTAVLSELHVVKTEDQNFNFILIPAGEFTLGCYDEIHTIDYDYWIMKYEVTTKQYVDFLNKALKEEIIWVDNDYIFTHFQGDSFKPEGDYFIMKLSDRIFWDQDQFGFSEIYKDHPIVGIGWFGCHVFCEYYGFRLPTGREWEKAARGKTGWDYPWGDGIDGSRANFHGSGGPFEGGTNPVGFYNGERYGEFQTNDSPSPYGLYDMSGNAWEYTSDLWSEELPFHIGAGGGFIYHTAAMTNTWYKSCYGLPYPLNLDRFDRADGFRAVKDTRE